MSCQHAFDLSGYRVMVSGAASGIGAAVCVVASKLGGDVIPVDTAEATDTAEAVREGDGRASAIE
jgi:NAD(P)-dependent dehydrogenase (short-subunit alcohol dehydrogenase family)